MGRSRRIVSVVALTVAPITVQAQTNTDIGRALTLTIERYQQDRPYLADPARRTGHWAERFKYIPLNEEGELLIYEGTPHGLADTHKDRLNQDLLTFLRKQ